MMGRRAVVGGLAASVLAPSAFAAGADDWPERPVRIVVPFSAGGAADTFGRFYADALSNALAATGRERSRSQRIEPPFSGRTSHRSHAAGRGA